MLDKHIAGPIGYPANGDLEPLDNRVHWYQAGTWPMPGYPGPAVLVGHISFYGHDGVFRWLGRTQSGDTVSVYYDSGDIVKFRVTSVQHVNKDQLPVNAIWNSTLQPELRLITCDPTSTFRDGHYQDNIIVYADELIS